MRKRMVEPSICNGRTPVDTNEYLASKKNGTCQMSLVEQFDEQHNIVRKNFLEIANFRNQKIPSIAEMCGLTTSGLFYWAITQNRMPTLETCSALIQYIGCTCSEFFLGTNKPVVPPIRVRMFINCLKTADLDLVGDYLKQGEVREPTSLGKLVYERLDELAKDNSTTVNNYFLEYRKEVKQRTIESKNEEGTFVSRIPAFYALCVTGNVSPDYLLLQDYSSCELAMSKEAIRGTHISNAHSYYLSHFLRLSQKGQAEVLGKLLADPDLYAYCQKNI